MFINPNIYKDTHLAQSVLTSCRCLSRSASEPPSLSGLAGSRQMSARVRQTSSSCRFVDKVAAPNPPVPGLRESLEGKPVFKHAVTRFLHVVSSEEGTHFRCGRRISTSYQECRELPKVLFPVCKQCCPDA